MNIKTTIITVATIATITANAGLYFVSGGDFRKSNIKYIIETTEPNQEVELTPYKVRTLGIYQHNKKWAGEWSIKYDGIETIFEPSNIIRQAAGTWGNVGKDLQPVTKVYQEPGKHLVKIYDTMKNIYQVEFSNPYITSLYIDFSDRNETSDQFGLSVLIPNSPNLKSIYYGNPTSGKNNVYTQLQFPTDPPLLEKFELKNPEVITRISPNVFQSASNLVDDVIFPNVTNIMNQAFKNSCLRVQYASFPNLETIGESVFNLAGFPRAMNGGLRKLRIGDKMKAITGQNTFYGMEHLDTIEFVTDQEDWIAAWNNNPILPLWLGPASAIEGKTDEAKLTPVARTIPDSLYTGTRYPKPTKLVLIRRGE